MYGRLDRAKLFTVTQALSELKQGNLSVTSCFNRLFALWNELEAAEERLEVEGSSSAPARLSNMMTPQECELPVIDLSQRGAEEHIFRAAKECGRFRVVKHGISSKLLRKMRREEVKLFEKPLEIRARSGLLNNSSPRGTSPAQFSHHVPLMKIYDSSCHGQFTSLGGVMLELAPAMFGLTKTLAGFLEESLGHQGGSTFKEKCDKSTCFLQLNHYPVCPLSPETFQGVPHGDNYFLTILSQDQVGGNRDALIVSIGDLLQAWSNDVYRSVEQKVRTKREVERYSVAFSLCPSPDSQIGSCRKPSVYGKFTFGEYREQGRIYGLQHFRLTESVDVSTDLALYKDPWKIRKKLTESDLSPLSRLLLPGGCLQTHVFPQMDEKMLRHVKSEEGMPVVGKDVATGHEHQFVFRCWKSTGSYVLNGGWTKEFVEEKRLKVGDEIGMVWFMSSRMFYFKVLHRAAA
ncbi:gibberellin 2-beta-dioxygenase 6-like [Eucalyptus grandis]|uniref:gibberellin 2-beta-dioxygenase 6-like n=1 Tax=Eucalyptus grandis TaxID=71139 RepID=UPI00192EA214|nr:gibberellin 2-beta-dioxygenase 6-like [Eucalyptus grandis]